ncbi:hypothetical protein [Bradyrhizobium sp. 169]|uniref:hypothetical protein n=1 Tax=Bradyrhizobium sp. 169 TaxID=2782640 RepID=UPI001FFA82DB|nr:hypothetical protein [Bradyrhizobium sp. 169]MCK1586315.1 hypothetical protein [Bradyrhizobium sp. 169]
MPSLKNTCTKFDIPVPPRGYWAKLQAGKPTAKAVLPARAPGMSDEIHLGDRYYWQRSLTDEELLGSLPDRPEFSEDITLVRERIEKAIGTFKVGRVLTIKHPAVLKLLAQDEARREKQKTATYAFSWEKPVLDTPFEQRRLRLLNALFLAVARCGGKAEVRGPEAREVTITVHQTAVFLTLDRPKVTRRGAAQGFYPTGSKSDPLRLAITEGYQREEERAAWQDSEDGPLERLMAEIAVEIVTAAELKYREGCVRQFEWRAKRKAEREEELRQRQLEPRGRSGSASKGSSRRALTASWTRPRRCGGPPRSAPTSMRSNKRRPEGRFVRPRRRSSAGRSGPLPKPIASIQSGTAGFLRRLTVAFPGFGGRIRIPPKRERQRRILVG